MVRLKLFNILFFTAVAFVVFGQACLNEGLQTNSDSSSSTASQDGMSGNGGGYEGKPLIFHADQEEVLCHGVKFPKTVLIYYVYNKEWYLVDNSNNNCDSNNRKLIDGVIYDSVSNTASVNNLKHVPPKAYLVDATTNADLPDLVKDDGICMTELGTCSLRAAFEQASVTAFTEDVTILIPEGHFLISKPLIIDGAPMFSKIEQRNYKISIIGQGGKKTLIDGQQQTNLLKFEGVFYDVIKIVGIGFVNGTKSSSDINAPSPVSVTNARYDSGNLPFAPYFYFDDCYFANNTKGPALNIFSWYTVVTVSNSLFENNQAGGLTIRSNSGSYLVENSYFSGNKVFGMEYGYASVNINVEKSIFYNNQDYGLNVQKCLNCSLKDSLVYRNGKTGLYLRMTSKFYGPGEGTTDFNISNSIFAENGLTDGANLDINYAENSGRVLLNNSILKIDPTTRKNCLYSFSKSLNYPLALVANNNYINDTSCESTGTGNVLNSVDLKPIFDLQGYLLRIEVISPSPTQ